MKSKKTKKLKYYKVGDLIYGRELIIERNKDSIVSIVQLWDYPSSGLLGYNVKSRDIGVRVTNLLLNKIVSSQCISNGEIYENYKQKLEEARLWRHPSRYAAF